jgi:glycosyltransferase involved in cell wall biosynthesis
MLSAILQYSTNDFRFLETNLRQLSKVCDEIIIPVCTHFFEGDIENDALLDKTYEIARRYPKASVYMFEWQGKQTNPGYYHNMSRALGTQISTGDWLLFVDADEIIDDGFIDWFNSPACDINNTYWLTCYWYFREPIYQATTFEGCGLLIRKDKCNWNIDIREERQQLFHLPGFINGNYSPVLSLSNTPMIHHFSWVRTKEEMLTKVRNWGHRNDPKDWTRYVEDEFTHDFNGKDFVHGYSYITVANKFNL